MDSVDTDVPCVIGSMLDWISSAFSPGWSACLCTAHVWTCAIGEKRVY